MKYKSWYMTAKTVSKNNEELDKVFTEYENMEKTDERRASSKEAIIKILDSLPDEESQVTEADVLGKTKIEVADDVEEDDVDIEDEEDEGEEPLDSPKDESPCVARFEYTEKSIKSIKTIENLRKVTKACKDEKEILRRTRLLDETWQERKLLNREIWKIERIRNLAKKKINDIKRAEKLKIKSNGISAKAKKQNKFCKLYKQGYSFSNIMLHSEGIKIKEAAELVDDTVIEECSKVKGSFAKDWAAWKEKFLNTKK